MRVNITEVGTPKGVVSIERGVGVSLCRKKRGVGGCYEKYKNGDRVSETLFKGPHLPLAAIWGGRVRVGKRVLTSLSP